MTSTHQHDSTVSEATARELMDTAIAAYANAYAPYSQFRVGAALLTAETETQEAVVFQGCNVENAAYSLAICAERVAITQAVAKGYRQFRAIAVVAEQTQPCFPCGSCRQFLSELAPTLEVIILEADGSLSRHGIAELLPYAFNAEALPPR